MTETYLERFGDQIDTLAYWVCLSTSSAFEAEEELEDLFAEMERQREREVCCVQEGSVIPEDMRGTLRPLAPIQLARGWTLLRELQEALGPPRMIRMSTSSENDGICLLWPPSSLMRGRDLKGGDGERDRAAKLLRVGRDRAAAIGSSLVVVARSGWPVEDSARFSEKAAEIMLEAGFVFTDRHP